MTASARRRVETRVRYSETAPWSASSRAKRPFPVFELVAGIAVLLCLAWWAASPEVLVGSASRDGGRVLSCRYLSGTRVVERQFVGAAHGTDGHACPLFRMG